LKTRAAVYGTPWEPGGVVVDDAARLQAALQVRKNLSESRLVLRLRRGNVVFLTVR
jgi:hypothetical protein